MKTGKVGWLSEDIKKIKQLIISSRFSSFSSFSSHKKLLYNHPDETSKN